MLKLKMAWCQHCGKYRVLHKVKYESGTGIGSMWVCDPCDETDVVVVKEGDNSNGQA